MYIHIYMCTLYIYWILCRYTIPFSYFIENLCVCTYVHLGVKYINNQMDHVQRLRHRRCNHPPFDVLLLRSFNLRNCSFRLVTIVIIKNNKNNWNLFLSSCQPKIWCHRSKDPSLVRSHRPVVSHMACRKIPK